MYIQHFFTLISVYSFSILIGYVEAKTAGLEDSTWKGYVYAAALFVVASTQSVFFHQNFHICMTAGMRIKSALISAVYNKVSFCLCFPFWVLKSLLLTAFTVTYMRRW